MSSPTTTILIICSRYHGPLPIVADVLIGVEQGCLEIIDRKLCLDWAIGDFDHVTTAETELIHQHCKELIIKTRSDQLDGELAVQTARKKYQDAVIYFLVNSNQIDLMSSGINLVNQYDLKAWINGNYIAILNPGYHQISPLLTGDCYFSLFSFKVESIVSISQARYTVANLKIPVGSNCAVRNLFLNSKTIAEIKVKSGQVTLIIPPKYSY